MTPKCVFLKFKHVMEMSCFFFFKKIFSFSFFCSFFFLSCCCFSSPCGAAMSWLGLKDVGVHTGFDTGDICSQWFAGLVPKVLTPWTRSHNPPHWAAWRCNQQKQFQCPEPVGNVRCYYLPWFAWRVGHSMWLGCLIKSISCSILV